MMHRLFALVVCAAFVAAGLAADKAEKAPTAGLEKASITLKSAGPLAFGPQGILFIGDPQGATIYAVDTGDRTASTSTDKPKVEGVNEKVASLLGAEASEVRIADLAVNPVSGNTYLSVARGKGPKAAAVVVKVGRDGKLSELSLADVKSSKVKIPNPGAAGKGGSSDVITHMAFVKGKLLIAGMSSEKFASTLRSVPFPFKEEATTKGTGVEIYHGAHGAIETRSPIRVFAPYKIGDEEHILAAYQCTPLVKLPVNKLEPGTKLKGTTVAELGNRNRPLSIIVYNKGGKDYALIANNARGLMKVSLEGVDKAEGISERISGTAGLKYDTVKGMSGVQKLDAFGKDHALVLVQGTGGKMTLQTMELP